MSTISSGTTLTTALVQTGDTTGNLVIKTGASNTTAMTISGTDQSVVINGSLTANVNVATLTGIVAVTNGGTGLSSVGTAGNVLTSNGTAWVSTAPAPSLPIVVTPTNVSPATSSTDIFPGQVLSATGFFALYGYTFANAQWQVSTSAGFGTTVFDSGTSGAAVTSITISDTYVDENTTYYWRVRYKASDGTFSSYSTAFSFTTAVSFTYSIDYLMVAGGGAGGYQIGGGGGAGGYLANTTSVGLSIAFPIVIGAGGSAVQSSSIVNGSDTTFNSLTAVGGGGGAYGFNNGVSGNSGGSGGGGAGSNATGGAGGSPTSGQGFAGGAGAGSDNFGSGGAGGGAAEAGNTDGGNSNSAGGFYGGDGLNWQSLGTYYAGGGAGGYWTGTGTRGVGGLGGGGDGGSNGSTGLAGSTNTGGGGGGGSYNGIIGGSGGSGIVIIRYAGSQRGTGGTVTSAGGYTYHTFTSSATYTS
jgi:hypothetical protein